MPTAATAASTVSYLTRTFYADAECSGDVQSVYMTEDSDCANSIDGYTGCSESGNYYAKQSCTTDRTAKMQSAFGDNRFVAYDEDMYTDCDMDSYRYSYGFLASGTCQSLYYNGGSVIASVDDQGLTTLQVFESYYDTDCSGDSYTIVLDADFMADPYCIGYGTSGLGYMFIPMVTDLSTLSANANDEGVVISVYEDEACTTPATSVYIAPHPTCSDTYTTASCVPSYAGSREVFYKMECMNKWSDRDARMELLAAAFGSDAYLAFDSLTGSCDGSDTSNVDFTYAYLADGLCHDAFDHESTRISLADDGSAVMERASRLQDDYDCEQFPTKTSVSSDEIEQQSCVTSNSTGFVFYTTSDIATIGGTSTSNTAGSGSSGQPTSDTASGTTSSQAYGYQTDASGQQTDASGGGTTATNFDSGGGNTGTIAIIAGCAVAVVLIALLFVWRFHNSRNNNSSRNDNRGQPNLQEVFIPPVTNKSQSSAGRTHQGSTDRSGYQRTLPSSSGSLRHTIPSTGLWNDPVIISARVPREKVVMGEVLSRGGFGEVYVGTFNAQPVAIKMLLPEMRRDLGHVNMFLAEAKLMATLDHPCIVQFVGVAWDSLTDLCVMSEFMTGGDLRTLLSNFQATNHPTGFDYDKLRIAYNVAQALTYLHSLSPVVIHRDLKSRNVLLTEDTLEAKLTDFGVSRERAESTMTAGVGTSLWMAPEVMLGERYDEKADVFSFGVLLSELDTHALPYSHTGISQARLLQLIAERKVQVQFSSRFDSEATARAVELGMACVSMDPAGRPTAAQALYQLQMILRSAA